MSETQKDIDYAALGRRIKKVRALRGLTQEALAEKCSIIGSYVGVIERAEKKASIATLVKIANALNVSMDYLLFESLEQNPDRIFDINGDTCHSITEKSFGAGYDTLNSLLNRLNNPVFASERANTELVLKILSNITNPHR